MKTQIVNVKTFFIVFLWVIVAICAVISLYYFGYIYHFGYTDSRIWIDMGFYGAIAFCATVVAAGFNKRKIRKRFYKKQLEILHLFTETNSSIFLHQVLSKASFSEVETKGILEHLVEKKILFPSFSEEQKLVYTLANQTELDKYLKKIH